ncbi:unnamed protein product, partial [Meganyctiphanes norvegica]
DKTIDLNTTIQKNSKSKNKQKQIEKILEKKSYLENEVREILKRYNPMEEHLREMKNKNEERRVYEELVCSTLSNEYSEVVELIDSCFTKYSNINHIWALANYAEENQIPPDEKYEDFTSETFKEIVVLSIFVYGYENSSET